MPKLREFDYYYTVYVTAADGSRMFVNNERHWKDQNGNIHINRVDMAKVPLMIEHLEVAKAVRRAVNGQIRRVAVGEVIDDDFVDM
ncbi:MAG: hypothetical protein K6F23_15945 [Solobacterium sp.]|nr:hypothetical protein [Solobacterium sp.]